MRCRLGIMAISSPSANCSSSATATISAGSELSFKIDSYDPLYLMDGVAVLFGWECQ